MKLLIDFFAIIGFVLISVIVLGGYIAWQDARDEMADEHNDLPHVR